MGAWLAGQGWGLEAVLMGWGVFTFLLGLAVGWGARRDQPAPAEPTRSAPAAAAAPPSLPEVVKLPPRRVEGWPGRGGPWRS